MSGFVGKHICEKCKTTYEWRAPSNREGIVSFSANIHLYKNVRDCFVNDYDKSYVITTYCPECGCPFTVRENREEE